MSEPADAPRSPRVGRWALGLLLLAMAAGQLADPVGFRDIVASYRLGGTAAAAVIAGLLVAGEVAAGAGLLAGGPGRRRKAASIALAVAAAWTALGVQAFVRGIAMDNCGCFGVYAGQPLRWWVLVEDIEFVALAVWVRRRSGLGGALRSRRRERADAVSIVE